MKNTLIVGMLIVLNGCTSQSDNKTLQFIEVSPKGYSQSVEVDNGKSKIIYISGQVAVNANGEIVGLNNLEEQTEQVFKNIKSLLEKSDGTMNDLVSIDCYFTDISKISEFRKARDKYINLKNPPASTAVQVERLINEDFLIEINAIAVVRN